MRAVTLAVLAGCLSLAVGPARANAGGLPGSAMSTGPVAALHARLDLDRDGSLSRAELRHWGLSPKVIPDPDRDGRITRQEYVAAFLAARRVPVPESEVQAEQMLSRAADCEARGDSWTARRLLEKAVLVAPGMSEPRCKLAELLERAGDLEGAAAHYERAAREAPEDPLPRLRLQELRRASRESGVGSRVPPATGGAFPKKHARD